MNKPSTLKKYCCLIGGILFFLSAVVLLSFKDIVQKTGTLKITFIHTANGKTIVLRDSIYTNPFGEQYSISKLKYYIGTVSVPGSEQTFQKEKYHLINAAEAENSFEVTASVGSYNNIRFLLGVDSISNCSGAQSGALDPVNDMFWTWNSGYVMFKLEGNSPASSADLQRIEHHVGGYKGNNNVAKMIQLNFSTGDLLQIKEHKITEIVIEMNMDHYWNAVNEIRINELPLIMTPGDISKKIAANFTGLFSVKSIKEVN